MNSYILGIVSRFSDNEKVDEKIFRKELGDIQVIDQHLGVGIEQALTINIGDFESVKGGIYIYAPVGVKIDKKEIQQTIAELKELAGEFLTSILKETMAIKSKEDK